MKDRIKQAKIILDSIHSMIQSALNKAKFNTKKRATIQALNIDGTANITMNGITYNNVKIRTGLLPQLNEVVWVEIPNNNFNDAYIDSANQVAGTGETVDPNSHTHTNKALLDTYTQTEVNLADAVSKKHEHNNLTLLQTITQSLIDTWNTVVNKVDKVTGKGLSTEDYTTTEKNKLSGIADNANNYVHPASHTPSIITQDASNRFVTDTEKTTWNAKQNALGFTPENVANKGVANGYAELDTTGKISSSQLPSYVDDVLEYASFGVLPATGESGKIYITIDNGKTYRWSGTAYAEISASLALGETSTTAYRGDRGKIAYDHSQTAHNYEPSNTNIQSHISNTSNPHSITKTQLGLGSVDNTSDADKPISTATQTALDGKVDDSQVLTDVPLNAVFTDTVTTINEKTGAIAKADIIALGIPAQDTVYVHPSSHIADMIVDGTTNKVYTATEKTKLAGVAVGAEVNQNAFSNILIGTTTISADGKTDTLELVAGTGVTLVADATNDKVTINGVNQYTLPIANSTTLGGVKSGTDISVDASGNVSIVDDSHNHVIANIDGLQDALNGKSATAHNHSLANLTEKNYSSLVSRPLDDDFHNLTELLSSINTDEILIYDSTNLTYKKITKQNLLSGISGSDYVVVQYEEEFTATEGQTIFNLTKGTYNVGTNRLQLFIIGVRQPNTSFTETSNTSITLKNGLSAGDPVLVNYISVMDVMNFIHAENHKIGGIDPISPDSIGASEVSHTHISSSVTDLAESVQDIVGEMISTNTEKGIAVTYDDTNGKINFDVNDPTITLTGDVSGSATMTNLGNVSITTIIADDSHNHIIENIDGLQTMLNTKAPSVSPILTGIPTAPTAIDGNNTTQIATTAFVKNTLTALGTGDMKRSIYDTNLNGKVDGAESADTAASLTGLTSTIAELNYVDGVTSAIQTQLNGKSPTSHASSSTAYGIASTSNYGHVKVGTGINVSTGSISVKYGTASGTACQGNDNRLSDGKVVIGTAQPSNQTCLWIDTN